MAKDIKLNSKAGEFSGYLTNADDQQKRPGIILIHEVWGLKPHIRDVADRLASQGYIVLAPDLLSQTDITEKVDQSILKEVHNPVTRDEAQKKLRAAMAPIMLPEFGEQTVEKLEQCFNYLQAMENCTGKIAVLGFCFGGTYSYALAVAGPKLSAAVVFYGHAPQPIDRLQSVACPVLVFNGGKDENLMKQLPEVKQAAEQFGKNFEFHQYAAAGHAFFNDTNPVTYNKEAAGDAWGKTLIFLSKNLS